jgi:hypothetical protein
LVDRSLWRHVRRWAGIMLAVVLVKPVLVIVLGLAAAIMADNGDSLTAVLTGLAILFVSIFASVVIYRFVPTFGDDVAAMSINRRSGVPTGAAAFTSPAGHVRNGMATHANRGEPRGSSAQTAAATPGRVATATAGMAAHGALRLTRVGRGGGSKQQPAHAVNGAPVNGTAANQSGGNGAGRSGPGGQATYHQSGQANGAANHPASVASTASSPAPHASPAASAAIAAPRPAAETDQVTTAARPANAANKHDLRGDR